VVVIPKPLKSRKSHNTTYIYPFIRTLMVASSLFNEDRVHSLVFFPSKLLLCIAKTPLRVDSGEGCRKEPQKIVAHMAHQLHLPLTGGSLLKGSDHLQYTALRRGEERFQDDSFFVETRKEPIFSTGKCSICCHHNGMLNLLS